MNQGECEIRYQPQYSVRQPERVEAAMTALLQLSRWTTGNQLQASRMTFAHPALDDNRRYQSLLGLPVRFAAEHNTLVLPASDLTMPLIHANPSLCHHLRTLADQLLDNLGSPQNSRWQT